MPPKTSGGLVAVIVYLPPEAHAKLVRVAEDADRTISSQARQILVKALGSQP